MDFSLSLIQNGCIEITKKMWNKGIISKKKLVYITI